MEDRVPNYIEKTSLILTTLKYIGQVNILNHLFLYVLPTLELSFRNSRIKLWSNLCYNSS